MSTAVDTPEPVTAAPLNTTLHQHGPGRPCVHALTEPPEALLVDREAVARLNFQPRVIAHGAPCIASRIGSELILSFDVLGPTGIPHANKGTKAADQRIHLHWRYQLHATDDETQLLAIRDITGTNGA